jgi:prevent-host-death family protein
MRKRSVAGARELKTHLGSYLRKVRQGTTVVVTDRGEPIAELRPLSHGPQTTGAALARLLAVGALTRRTVQPLSPFRPIRARGVSLAAAVIEDRTERF